MLGEGPRARAQGAWPRGSALPTRVIKLQMIMVKRGLPFTRGTTLKNKKRTPNEMEAEFIYGLAGTESQGPEYLE